MEDLTLEKISSMMSPRPLNSHKGCFGHVLVVGGDYGMPGSVRLAAEGALRVGAGLVSVITHIEHIPIVMSGRPELLCYGLDEDLDILEHLLTKVSVIILGPGLGQSAWSRRLFEKTVSTKLPLVIDADGLNLLSQANVSNNNWILTPHPGEAARLLNTTVQYIQDNRNESINLLHNKYDGVIVLKGANSLIKTESQPISRCLLGNPGMASAGMGDLLSGVIGGLVATGLNLWNAAQAGVFLHAMAGDLVAKKQGEKGLLASDLLDKLPLLVNFTSPHTEP